jgi:hypothetical protein
MDDVAVAGTPVVRVSLDSLAVGGSLRLFVRIPDSAQWRRIRAAWGDHGYIIFATDPARRSLIPFGTLKLEVAFTGRDGTRLSQERPAEPPYGYSFVSDAGLRFLPRPGDEWTIVVKRSEPVALPEGELIVQPYWDSYMKDRIVGAHVETDFGPYVNAVVVAVGVLMLVASSVLGLLRRDASTRS